MRKVSLVLLVGILLSANIYAQQKTFGYKISGGDDILSYVFLVADGMKLDSIVNYTIGDPKTYRFEYNHNGKLKNDFGYMKYTELSSTSHRQITYSAYREYFYNERGDVDSIAYFYWNDTGRIDKPGQKINYEYDNDGKILTKTYLSDGELFRQEENSYDSFGNLVENKMTLIFSPYPTYNIWEYDPQNRLILKKSFSDSPKPYWDQFVYKYNSDGTIDCTLQKINPNSDFPIRYDTNYNFQFDQDGKLVNQTISEYFDTSDSTWKNTFEMPSTYDVNGRIVEVVNHSSNLFHYNSDGNLDSLSFRMAGQSGYHSERATIIDSYGNEITPYNTLGDNYFYYSGLTTGIKLDEDNIDIQFRLYQNYPNPFNPTTKIEYSVPKLALVQIKVYNVLGQEIVTLVNEEKQNGSYEAIFNGNNLSSGVYFYQMKADNYFQTKKFLLVK